MEKDKNKPKINLESLDRKNIHSVPDGYFDKLPYSIQEKIAAKQNSWFESLRLNPVKYALSGLAVMIMAFFIYLIIPKESRQLAIEKKNDHGKDTLSNNNNSTQKQDSIVMMPSPVQKNTVVIEQKKNQPDSLVKTSPVPSVDEKLGTPESYLAEISKDDIQEYLDLNETDEIQLDENLVD